MKPRVSRSTNQKSIDFIMDYEKRYMIGDVIDFVR
jgi:hypothetical protein